MAKATFTSRLADLRSEADVDHTLQNVLQALTLNLELRSRYRVYEFEARQNGANDSASVFADLIDTEAAQIATLLTELRRRLSAFEGAGEGAA
jgi:hypothetical protein